MGALCCPKCGRPIGPGPGFAEKHDPAVCQVRSFIDPEDKERARLACDRAAGHRRARHLGHGAIVDVIEAIGVAPWFPLSPVVMVTPDERPGVTAGSLVLRAAIVNHGEVHADARPFDPRLTLADVAEFARDIVIGIVDRMLRQAFDEHADSSSR